ncbi:MAG TPA: helix-turn-helix domain-containing protein [Kineosporiaceae bacterium]
MYPNAIRPSGSEDPAPLTPDGATADRPPTLSAPARLLFRWLSHRGTASLEEVIALGMPGTDRALVELGALGLLHRHASALAARPYHDVLRETLITQAQVLGQAMDRLTEGQRRLHLLIAEHDALLGDSAETVQTLGQPGATQDWLAEQPLRAEHRLATLIPSSDYSDEVLETSLARAAESLSRGVALQVVHQRSMLAHPRRADYLRRLEQLGAVVRLREHVPFRMMIIDDRAVGCALHMPGGAVETFVLRGQRLVALLGRIFESVWFDADPITNSAADPIPADVGGALTRQHLTILRYLAEGATDQGIARALGVTPRTVTRRLNEIYEVLGVQSRFQAGSAARRLGLV